MNNFDNLEEIFKNSMSYIARSTCINRSYCAIIVCEDGTQYYGYSHPPNTFENCKTINKCKRNEYKRMYSKNAEFFEVCQVIHAEMDVLLKMNPDQRSSNARFYLLGIVNKKRSIYLNAFPCEICKKLLIEAGFTRIFVFQSSSTVKEISLF